MAQRTNDLGRAEACANIALAKYWGKSKKGDNLTAVPSLSMTLDSLRTRTEVKFETGLTEDLVVLNSQLVHGSETARVSALLDRFRNLADIDLKARVTSMNNFPTAAGLASSASGFAALAAASSQACGLELAAAELSSQARKSSASAGRSLFGGFVELLSETPQASPVAPANHFPLAMIVLIVRSSRKEASSSWGMQHTASTCPYYESWLHHAPEMFAQVRSAVLEKDFTKLAEAMEHSTRLMHATMMTSLPPILYFRGATVELMHEVAKRRAAGHPEAYTMDAGPNVKVLTPAQNLEAALAFYKSYPGVESIVTCRPGPGTAFLSHSSALETAQRENEVS